MNNNINSRAGSGQLMWALKESRLFRQPSPESLCGFLELMGPVYVKLGQILSCGSAVLPPEYCAALSRLRTDVLPLPFPDVCAALQQEYGQSYGHIFRSIEAEPLGAASVAQVHAAVLKNGTPVAVKLLRPGIRVQMSKELHTLHRLLPVAGLVPAATVVQPGQILDELEQAAAQELNMQVEAENLTQFLDSAQGRQISCPKVYRELCTENVLVMERVEGIRADELAALKDAGIDLRQLCRAIYLDYAAQILQAGLFHGDPHPGNLIVTPAGPVWIDLGVIGTLTPALQHNLKCCVRAFVFRDMEAMAQALVDMGCSEPQPDLKGLTAALTELVGSLRGVSVHQLNFPVLGKKFLDTARQYGVQMPRDVAILTRSMLPLMDLLLQLDPEPDLITIMTDVAPFCVEQ